MANRRFAPTEEERRLWREVMRDVKPLAPPAPDALSPEGEGEVHRAGDGRARETPPSATLPSPQPSPSKEKGFPPPPLVPGSHAGLDRRTDEKLRRGKMEIGGRLDLHGLTQAEAHHALAAFVQRAHREGRRTLLVITGKGAPPGSAGAGTHADLTGGRGVLRSAVPRWLGEAPLRPLVLAVRQAQPQHGGGGAFYVLLKRHRAS